MLCDALVHFTISAALPQQHECILLEVGAGTGLIGLVSALTNRFSRVIVTDYEPTVLRLCHDNIQRNGVSVANSTGTASPGDETTVRIHTLDLCGLAPCVSTDPSACAEFGWSPDALIDLSRASWLVAADLIYDDHLTDGLVVFVHDFLTERPDRHVLLAIECRRVFTIKYGDAVPTVEYLIATLRTHHLQASLVPLEDIPQYTWYARSPELLLLRISIDLGVSATTP